MIIMDRDECSGTCGCICSLGMVMVIIIIELLWNDIEHRITASDDGLKCSLSVCDMMYTGLV